MKNTQINPLNFSQLLMTKFCHDITGPIGAINNGVECINEDASMREAGMALIADSAQQAIARIQFYRFTYGILKGESTVDISEKRAQARAFFGESKLTLHWPDQHHEMSQKQCQILCNMLVVASSALIRGGEIHVAFTPYNTQMGLEVRATGTHVRLDDKIYHALTDSQHNPDNKSVQACYTRMLVDSDAGASLTLHIDEHSCTLIYHPQQES